VTTEPPARDFFDLADYIAEAVGGPVIIEDSAFRVLGYSAYLGEADRGRTEAILGRRIPQEWLDHLQVSGALSRLVSSTAVVDVRDGPWEARRRLILVVHEHGRHLGVIWATEAETPLAHDAEEALLSAGRVAAPALHRHAESVAADADRRGRQVRAVLDGAASQVAVAELGLSVQDTTAVLAVSGADDHSGPALLTHVGLCLDTLHQHAVATTFGSGVLVLARVEDTARATRLAHELVRLAGHGSLAPVRVGVSTAARGLRAVPRLRDEAVSALAAPPGADAVVRFDEIEAQILVRSVLERSGPTIRLTGLDRLRAYDEHRGTELVASLGAYLDAACAVRPAAAVLGVHPTTLQYRLNRIGDLSGLDLGDPEVRLAVSLALRSPASERVDG
jgi:DNA-binding PucR family transcriptional regulator